MNFLKAAFTFICFVIVFSGCKNDLKINAPYREIPSIYAVLTPQDKIQMIRVNKVFLGESDANAMAQIADSINYEAGELKITLTRFVNGLQTAASPNGNQEILFRDSVIQANPGPFNTTQRVYVSSEPLFKSGEYRLSVLNNTTGNKFTAKANSLDSIAYGVFRPFVGQPYPVASTVVVNPDDYIMYDQSNPKYALRFATREESKVYQIFMRVHYYDSLGMNIPNNYRFVEIPFNTQLLKDAQLTPVPKNLSVSFPWTNIFSAVGVSLSKSSAPVSSIVGRRVYKMEFMVYSSSQEYIDYLQFASPSLSIAQDKPLYSNFDNQAALGIFTFRSRASINKSVDAPLISEFRYSPFTCAYKFFNADRTAVGCP